MLRNLDNLINMVVYEISVPEVDLEMYTDLGKLKLIQFYLMYKESDYLRVKYSYIDAAAR